MSKKRYFNITLNGEPFILDIAQSGVKLATARYNDIYDAYNTPSRYKVDIWKDWVRWFHEHDGRCSIASRNSSQFTTEKLAIVTNAISQKLTIDVGKWLGHKPRHVSNTTIVVKRLVYVLVFTLNHSHINIDIESRYKHEF